MGQKTMRVELLSCTPQAEEIIATGAKLCYSDADIQDLKKGIKQRDQTKFIEKLMEMGHHSPIEHAAFTFGIEGVSRSLLAQITRHRIASFSVQSQRYVGKQSREEEDGIFDYIIPPQIQELGEEAVDEFQNQMGQIQTWYDRWQSKLGGDKEASNEDARFVLPNACETKMMVTMNARELLHFFRLRCCQRAQWEIRSLADEMLIIVREKSPYIFGGAGPGCLAGTCPEGKMSCGRVEEMRKKYLDK